MKTLQSDKSKVGKVAAFAMAGMFALGANASSVTIDSVTQRWPWNNKVDITYTVTDGQNVAAGVFCRLVFTANVGGSTYTIDGVHDVGANASSGTHHYVDAAHRPSREGARLHDDRHTSFRRQSQRR